MKLREVFRYEVEHRLRSPSTWIYAAIVFGIAFAMMLGSDGRGSVDANAPSQVAVDLLLLGTLLLGLPISAGLFGDAAVRDVQAGMDPLLFTAPLRKLDYLGGRFLAAAAINALVLLALTLGFALPVLIGIPDASAFGPFRIGTYVQPYMFILLPNMLFAGAILFTIGVLARRILPVYIGAIGLFIGTMISIGPDDDFVHPLLSILTPAGFHALNELTKYWTAAERNAQLIGLPQNLLWNRLVWLTVAAAVLGVLYRRFRFAHPDGRRRRRRSRRVIAEADSVPREPVAVPRVAGSFRSGTTVRQTLAVARNSLAEIAGNRWFVLVLLACVILTLIWGNNVGGTVFDTSTWPTTLLIGEVVLSQRMLPLMYLLIAVYAGELVWKDRDDGVAEMTDAAPVPESAALVGRFIALIAILVMIQAATTIGGILIQASQGYYDFEPGLYVRVFGFNLASYILLAALAMTIHVLVNHKHLGHMMVLLAILFTSFAGRLGIEHNLLIYGRDPGWTYSDMNGFGPFVEPFVWFKLYWGSWALMLGIAAVMLWVRGREADVRRRLRQARARFAPPVARTAAFALVLILLFGGFIAYNTNILNEYRASDEQGATQAEYERRYGRYATLAQPTIVAAGLRVEIYPDQQAVDVRGSYRLVNQTAGPIDSVHVLVSPELRTRSITVGRATTGVVTDEEVGYHIFGLAQPLQPGDSMQVSFVIGYRRHGFPNRNIPTSVADNVTSFDRRWVPFIGYQPLFELRDQDVRERFGLPPQTPLPSPADTAARRHRQPWRDADRVHVEMVIGTGADHVAVTPGVLRREWTEDGRRYFHYATERPEPFGANVFSGRYARVDDRWNDVALKIFHHPAHRYNLDSFLAGMKAALAYLSAQFGAYPYDRLSIVEVPRYDSYGRAHPYIIEFTENHFFTRPKQGQFDQVFFGTAHEVAHTWWGGRVRSASDVRGGQGFISESLANYSAMMVTEKAFGADAARKVFDYQMNRYLSRRGQLARDVPLLESQDQAYIFYGKGAIAMYTLREHIGEERVNTALRRFIDAHAAGVPPYPTSYDLFAELEAATPDSLRYLLTDWFGTVTLWDVATTRIVVQPAPAGEYAVTLDVVGKKMRSDSIGNETEVPMNDLIEIGVFAQGREGQLGEPLYVQRHRIRSGEQTIRITVPREPARAGIDPYGKLIDRRRHDNVVAREGPPPGR